MKENWKKGISMMELIVTVAVIGIFTGLSTIGVQYIQSGNVKAAAQTIDSNLSKLKYDAHSQATMPVMYIYMENGFYYMQCNKDGLNRDALIAGNGKKLCNSNCKIQYDDTHTVGASDIIKIAYKKGTGGFSSLSTPRNNIIISNANGTHAYKITIVFETGKHYLEKA